MFVEDYDDRDLKIMAKQKACFRCVTITALITYEIRTWSRSFFGSMLIIQYANRYVKLKKMFASTDVISP